MSELLSRVRTTAGLFKQRAPEILSLRGYLSGIKIAAKVLGEYQGFAVRLSKVDFWQQPAGPKGRILIGVNFSVTKGGIGIDEIPGDAETAMVMAREELFSAIRKREGNIREASQATEREFENIIVRDKATKKRTLRIAEDENGTKTLSYNMVFVLQF